MVMKLLKSYTKIPLILFIITLFKFGVYELFEYESNDVGYSKRLSLLSAYITFYLKCLSISIR